MKHCPFCKQAVREHQSFTYIRFWLKNIKKAREILNIYDEELETEEETEKEIYALS